MTTQLRLLSDLHLEFTKYKFNHIWEPNDEDKNIILLLAGDIGVGEQSREFIENLCNSFKHVLKICGNHEFYNQEFFKVIDGWKKIEEEGPKNFHFLHNDYRIIDGIRFLGGTMWTSLKNADPIVVFEVRNGLNDYSAIKNMRRPINPDFIIDQHTEFMKFLRDKLSEEFDGKTVIMTHHSPGDVNRSEYQGGNLDYAYYACLENLMLEQDNIDLWVHGHTHVSQDYMINQTRIVCNPFGYMGYSTNNNFNKNLILEI